MLLSARLTIQYIISQKGIQLKKSFKIKHMLIIMQFIKSSNLINNNQLFVIKQIPITKPLLMPTISFAEKYALIYYTPVLYQLISMSFLLHTYNIKLFFAINTFIIVWNYYVPLEDRVNTKFSLSLNKTKWALIPVILYCLSTPIALYLVWSNYDQLILSTFDWIVGLYAISNFLGASINASHELFHRQQIYCKIVSFVTLFFYQFTIYPIEHLYLHHKKVGTPEDPITAPKNENIYHYFINAIWSAYKFNYDYSKTIFIGCVLSTLMYIFLVVWMATKEQSGLDKIMFFVLFSYASLFQMESVQYIEHYGLIYRSSDKEKTITQMCSWNSSQNFFSNVQLFRLQRHSDHHMNAYKLYNSLDLTQRMPQYPFDFPITLIIVMIPSLWHFIANPLVDQIIEGKKVSKQHLGNIKMIINIVRGFFLLNLLVHIVI